MLIHVIKHRTETFPARQCCPNDGDCKIPSPMNSVNSSYLDDTGSRKTSAQVFAVGYLSEQSVLNSIDGVKGNPKGGTLSAPVQKTRSFSKVTG